MNHSKNIEPQKARVGWGFAAIALFFAVLFSLGIISYQNRIMIAQWGLSKVATKFDFSEARFKVSSIEMDRLVLKDIWLGPDVNIGSIRLDYAPSDLMRAQLKRLELRDADIDISDLNSGALAKIKKLSDSDQHSSSASLFLPDTTLKNLKIHGQIEDTVFDFNIDAHIKPNLSGEFTTYGKAAHSLFAPLKISGSGLYSGSAINFSFSAQDQEKRFATDIEGQADIALRKLSAKIIIPDIVFSPEGLQPKDLSPLAQLPFPLDSTLSSVVHLLWQDGVPAIQANVSLKNTKLSHGETEFSMSQAQADVYWPNEKINITSPKALISYADKAFELSGLNAAAQIDPKTGNIPFSLSKLNVQNTDSPAFFNPLQLSASGQLRDQVLDFKLTTKLLKGPQIMHAHGVHSISNGKGYVSLTIPQLNFDENNIKPKDIIPSLSILEETSGAISGRSNITWSPAGLTTQGNLVLSDLSIRADRLSLKDIKANLRLSSLWPPRTSTAQTIQGKEISSGIAFENPNINFSINGPTLEIHKLYADLLGGDITIQDMLIDPNAKSHKLVLGLNHLDLTKLFDLIELEGVAGTGKMTGKLPITISNDDITLKNGLLVSDGPGVIQFRSTKAKQALAGAGEQVELLLSVLNNFHYDKLSLTLQRELSNDAFVGLHIKGRNPEVMSGRAFNLNINLEGNVDPLLTTILEGYRLSDRAIRASLR